MRASTARLTNSPVRLADLQFPQVNRLIHRTRLAFIHLDNLLAFAKRDRDGRVDGFIAAYLPDKCFPVLQQEQVTGVLELISNGRVSYLKFDKGRYVSGYFCDKPDTTPPARYLESLFDVGPDGAAPAMGAGSFTAAPELPAQAPTALVNTYRELYWRIVEAVDREFPGEAKKRAQKVTASIVGTHQALTLLSVPRGADTPDSVVRPEELSTALTDWTLQ